MNDDELLGDLRRVLEDAEPIPPSSIILAEAALGWRTIDAELAELVHDSSIHESELLVRSSGDPQRVLSFANQTVRIDVEFANGQLVGQVTPPAAATVEVRRASDETPLRVEADEFGAFIVDDVPKGPVLLFGAALDGSWNLRTEWVNL